VRSLRTPRVEAILSLEREFAAGSKTSSLPDENGGDGCGSLFAAARGMDRPGGVPLDERTCLERGQFMSGACASLISKIQKVESFHSELAEGPLLLHQPVVGSIEKIPEPPSSGLAMD